MAIAASTALIAAMASRRRCAEVTSLITNPAAPAAIRTMTANPKAIGAGWNARRMRSGLVVPKDCALSAGAATASAGAVVVTVSAT